MTEKMLINRAKKLKALEERKAHIEAEINKVKAEIQNEMQDTEELKAGSFLFRWTHVVSNRFDSSALKKAMPELYQQYTIQTNSRRFSVTA